MIEFALALPVLLTLLLCGLEAANLVLAHLRISRIASMTADNASRVRDSIDESDINELMTGANLASGSFNLATNGRVILSDLQKNVPPSGSSTGQWIRWQRCSGQGIGLQSLGSSYGAQGAGQNDSTVQAMGPAGNQIAASDGTSVMFVEVRYWYTPLLPKVWGNGRTISYVSSFNVRKRPNGDPTNAGNLTPSQMSSC